jgi:ATP-dependent HslUV protease subunit HslV
MSVVIAVQKGPTIAIACDSILHSGSRREAEDNVVSPKIRRFGQSYVASTGWSVYDNVMVDYLSRRAAPAFRDEVGIYRFFLTLWKALRRDYGLVNEQCHEDKSPFGDLDSSFLIVNRNGIFGVDVDMSVLRYRKYHAIGSGSEYAMGAVHALYDHERDAQTIARRAADAAVFFEKSCGGAVQVFTTSVGTARRRR